MPPIPVCPDCKLPSNFVSGYIKPAAMTAMLVNNSKLSEIVNGTSVRTQDGIHKLSLESFTKYLMVLIPHSGNPDLILPADVLGQITTDFARDKDGNEMRQRFAGAFEAIVVETGAGLGDTSGDTRVEFAVQVRSLTARSSYSLMIFKLGAVD